jgi:hypothetical protein
MLVAMYWSTSSARVTRGARQMNESTREALRRSTIVFSKRFGRSGEAASRGACRYLVHRFGSFTRSVDGGLPLLGYTPLGRNPFTDFPRARAGVHGSGEPLVLRHGAFMSITNNWTGWIPQRFSRRQDGRLKAERPAVLKTRTNRLTADAALHAA